MRTVTPIAIALCMAFAAFAPPPSAGQTPDVTGTWKAEDVGFAPWTFKLKADSGKLTGTVSQGATSGGGWSTTLTGDTPIYQGTVSGTNLAFKCDSPDGARTISFSGAMSGDVITFKRDVVVQPGRPPGMNGIYGASGATNFWAKRVVGPQSEAAPGPAPAAVETAQGPTTELPVLKIADLTRVDRDTPPPSKDEITMTYLLKTSPHATVGDAYVIVTDQTNESFLEPLERLTKFHHGSIVHVDDLDTLATAPAERQKLISELRSAKPRFLAIAPRSENFSENTVLGMYSVLASLGDDRQIPVYPGFLAAPNAAALNALVNRSIHYQPRSTDQLHPFVMAQVLGPKPFGMRSLQKVRMLRNLFDDYGCTTHSLVVLANTAVQRNVSIAPVADEWQVAVTGSGELVKTIPPAARPALDQASLLLLFGHGSPGTQCSMDVSAFRDVDMTGKIVMSGDCFSAAAARPPGIPAAKDETFAMQAVDNGAVVVYAHMAENAGFPNLFPVLESWMDGLTVGEAYQRLLNALVTFHGVTPDALVSADQQSGLLYVVIGDPALQPLAKMTTLARNPSPQ